MAFQVCLFKPSLRDPSLKGPSRQAGRLVDPPIVPLGTFALAGCAEGGTGLIKTYLKCKIIDYETSSCWNIREW